MDELTLVVILLLFFFIVSLVFFHWLFQRREKTQAKPTTHKKVFFFSPKLTQERKERIQKMTKEREKKSMEKQRQELFRLFGPGEIKKRSFSYVDRLNKLVKHQEIHRKVVARLPPQQKEALSRLYQILEEAKKEAAKEEKKIAEFTEAEAKDVFERLKEIVKKS